ncbi:MAG TPA: XamI family restriction endonuclease [Rhodanobacteraceae bacterium]
MKTAPTWSEAELTLAADEAKQRFRSQRLHEPLKHWQAAFAQYEAQFRELFDEYNIARPADLTPEEVAKIFQAGLGDALRYLAAPPISADDLKVLADASLAPSTLARKPESAQRVLSTILEALDPLRFPWVTTARLPTDAEKSVAILASAVLATAQRVATTRRNDGKTAQEHAVRQYLSGIGMHQVETRGIDTLADAPSVGEFCAEARVGTRKADVSVRLYDRRLMPIECKVSNSATNSVKRLNNDAAVKAVTWLKEFGTQQVVPAAVVSGVFKVRNLVQAQESGLALFWGHDLERLGEFVSATRES